MIMKVLPTMLQAWERREESSIRYYNKMQELMKLGIEVIFVKVDSHTGELFNELADENVKKISYSLR